MRAGYTSGVGDGIGIGDSISAGNGIGDGIGIGDSISAGNGIGDGIGIGDRINAGCRRWMWVMVILLVACGSRRQTGHEWFGDTRASAARDSQNSDRVPLTREQARAALDRALGQGADADIVVYAGSLLAVGGALSGDERAKILGAIDRLDRAALAAIYPRLAPDVYPAPVVALRIAAIAAHVGDATLAEQWLARTGGAEAVVGADRLAAVRDHIARRAVEPDAIAVLLPLSGPFARLGAELESAIQFAARSAGHDAPTLHIVDTGGDERGAEAAVDKAVREHRAVAIIGPVGQRESLRAARRASQLGVPIALLSPGSSGAAPDAGVFRLWSSSAWEAGEAVRLAAAMGYDRLAVLAPRDEHGAEAARVFRKTARARNVSIVASGSYDPTASDLEPDIKQFLGLDPKQNDRLRRHLRRNGKQGWKTFSPDVKFDLLYIPDVYHRAALVAAYLPYFNVEVRSRDVMDAIALRRKHRGRIPQVVQLLGSSGWHHESLLPRGGTALDGALIVDVYAGGENEEFSTEEAAVFAEAYRRYAGRMPSAITAQAFDATTLVLTAWKQVTGSSDPRAAFVAALRQARLTDGVCGAARIGASGEIERQAILLRVDSGAFVLHEY